MSDKDFEVLKLHQYCDNANCSHYGQVGSGNLFINSRAHGQIYCNKCDSKPFSNHFQFAKGRCSLDFGRPWTK